MYKLSTINKSTIPSLNNNEKVHEIYYLRDNEICIRQTRTLSGYHYNISTKTWTQKWTKQVFEVSGTEDDYTLKRYPWLITDRLRPDKDIVILKHPDGIRLYEIQDKGLKLLKEDGNFHDSYTFKYLIGNFYGEKHSMGVMTSSSRGKIDFYAINKDSFKDDEDDPLFPLDISKSQFSKNWHTNTTRFYRTKFENQDAIVLKQITGELEFYQISIKATIKELLKTSQIGIIKKSDRLFFVNLTNQKFQDIVTLTADGLKVYQYDAKNNDYKLLHKNLKFTSEKGWKSSYSSSLQFMDMNNDQQDDLIYSNKEGLTIITFDVKNRKWDVLIAPESLTLLQRFGKHIQIINPDVANKSSIFIHTTDGSLEWARVIATEPVTERPTEAPKTTTAPAITTETKLSIEPRKELEEKPILRLTEYIDEDFIKETIDMANGQVDLKIPLVDTLELTGLPLKLQLDYNSQVLSSDLVGTGWSFPIGKDYIYVDYQGSIFLEDAIFYMVIQGHTIRLDLMSKTIDETILQFELTQDIDDEELTLEYNKSTQTWILNGETYQRVYGKANNSKGKDCLRWSLSYPNWRGVGTSSKGLEPIIISWYLNAHLDKKRNRTMYYDYMIDNSHFGNRSYNSAIFLKTIRNGVNTQLTFNYKKKTKDEYTISNPKNDDGKIEFPVLLTQDRYLSNYTIHTDNYQQSIRFQYDVTDKKRLLTAIEQAIYTETETVFKFQYEKVLNTYALTQMNSAHGAVMQFNYETLTFPAISTDRKNVLTYRTNSDRIKISYGDEYVVMGYDKVFYVHLQILNREMTEKITSLTCPGQEIKDYQIQTYKNYIVVSVTNASNQNLYVFTYLDEKWTRDPILYKFSKNVSIHFGDNLIAVGDSENSAIHLFDTTVKLWKDPNIINNFPFESLAVHKKYVIVYDDNNLWMFYHKSNQWHRDKLHHLPGKISQTRETIQKFDVNDDVKQQYIRDLTPNCFQMLKNIVIINTIRIVNDQLRSEIHLVTINAQHKVGNVQTYEFKRERIYDMLYKLEHEGTFMHITYVQRNGKYRLKVTALSGKVMEEFEKTIRNRNLRQDAIDKYIKDINKLDNFQKIFNENFLINWQSLIMHTTNEFIQHGDKDILQMTGIEWELKSLPKDFTIDLGKEFRVVSQDDEKKSFKLYKNGKSIKEFKITTPGYMVNRFPYYLAYQSRSHTVTVLVFKDDGKTFDREHIFTNEQLIFESSYQNLITKANTTLVKGNVEPYECLIRPMATLISLKKQYFVSETNLKLDQLQRKTAYDQSYKFNSETSMYTQTAKLVPSGNKTYSGWSEIIYSKNIHTGDQTKIRRWYNSKGTNIDGPEDREPSAAQKKRRERQRKEKPPKNPMLLMDQREQLVICDMSPYVSADEMISYYGFESYETIQSWKFDSKHVVKHADAFTGQNYLQIKNGSRLEGTFKPQDQHISYLASCWVRSIKKLKLKEVTSIINMNLRTTEGENIYTSFGQVKQQSNDWYYLELIIDFGVIKKVYQDYIEYYKKKKLPSLTYVQFQITLRIESESTIDLDHIRFSPLTHDFEAYVYHPKIGLPIATIHETGLVTRTIYNNFHKKIATIQQDGKIVELISTSETGRLEPAPRGLQFKNPHPSYLSFVPEESSYETFTRGWETDTSKAWHVATPAQLFHRDHRKPHRLSAVNPIDMNSYTLRFFIALQDTDSYLALILGNLGQLKLTKGKNFSTLTLPNDQKITSLPQSGEIIIMIEENFIAIWFDGVLIVDQHFAKIQSEQKLTLEAQGEILIEDFMILNRPHLEIQYMNELGEKIQVIKFKTPRTALVNQIIYDVLGRKAITAKTSRIHRKDNDSPLLVYRKNFVTNINPKDPKSVWHTNRLHGEIDDLHPADKGVAFIRTEYWDNPLNEEKILGLPGPEFSTSGACATWIAKHSKLAFMDNLFPKKLGYTQSVQISSNGAEKVTVYDQHRNKIAIYVHVPGFNHLLSTYEYNSDNQLTKILPPVYHEKVETALKITAYQPEKLTKDEKKWQELLATNIIYNKNGQVIRKVTPDFGPIDYLYDANHKLRFMVTSNETSADTLKTHQIVYFDHNELEQLTATGYFNETLSIKALNKYTESVYVPNTQKFQQLDYSDYHPNPQYRGRIKHCITYNDDGETVLEKIRYNSDEQIVERKTLSVIDDIQMEIKIRYQNDKIERLSYPKVKNGDLDLDFTYNRLGQLTELKASKSFSAKFSYYSTGELASESFHSSKSNLTRKYSYNSPGFLEQISDPYMTETMFYTEKGYGQAGYGDGIIMQTKFTNNWSKHADPRWFKVTEGSLAPFKNHTKLCLNALKQNGYLNNQNQPIKLYTIDADTTMPLLCGTGKTAQMLATIIAKKHVPKHYGYQFSYGNHQELIKAKYFTDDISNLVDPLQIDSFAKVIPELSNKESEQIWELLAEASYILKNQQRHNKKTAIGKRGKSFFRDKDLKSDLASLDQNYILYLEPIKQFIMTHALSKQSINLTEFIDAFVKWEGVDKSSLLQFNWYKKIGEKIGTMLKNNGYFTIKCLDNNFVKILSQFTKFIPKIVQILMQHFTYGLGETPFDHESYEIDANGNHQFFVSNFDKYQIKYKNYSNKIDKIEISKKIYLLKHDASGNIIHAMHRGIEHIEYHPVTQRAIRIEMANGQTLRFYYDAAGERILKKVFNSTGKLQYETRYVRDTKGRVLIDQRKIYLEHSTEEILTYNFYGPRGLIGFIRDDTYYHVLTDHAGSVRLIIRSTDNEVVTAFDYLPYGKSMRTFGDISFMYRYTGHEFDEETGLYNYHARLYDPSIGRFYQPDPKSQYFSPYMYAGNSPISTIDPDGEFAFLLAVIIVGAIAGAYLGGAAANNRWNPLKWDWKDPGTYFGMFFGGLSGAFLPVTLGGSVAFFGGGLLGVSITTALALTGSYVMMSAANGTFNPKKWDWSSPATLHGFFDGLGLITGLFTGVGAMHKFATRLGQMGSRLTKTKFLLLSYSSAIGVAYAHGVMSNEGKFAFWEWNWKNPNTYAALITGFDIGSGVPQNFKEMHLGFRKWRANKIVRVGSSKGQLLKAILKNPKHPLYKVSGAVVMGYFMGVSVNGDFDFTQWRFDTFATYEGVLNGIFLGKSGSKLLTMAVKSLRKNLSKLSPTRIINRTLRKNMRFIIDVISKNKKNSKFFNLIETNFHKLDPKLLERLPNALKQDIIEFFQAGYKKWKSGKTKMPKQLKEMLQKQVDKLIEGNSKQLKKWEDAAEDIHRQQQEIHTDRDLDFLNCRKAARRRRRALHGSVTCKASSSKTIDNDDENPQRLFNHLLEIKDAGLPSLTHVIPETNNFQMIQPKSANNPKGFDPHQPKDFSENFALILENSPFMFDVNKKDFTPQIIAGSLYSSTSNLRGNIDDIYMKTDSGKGHSLLKVAFKTVVNGETTLVLKTFVVETKKTAKSKFNEFNNIYDKDELKAITDKLKMPDGGKYPIKEHVFFIKHGHHLYGKDVSTTSDHYTYNTNFKGDPKVLFKEINPNLSADFETRVTKIRQTDDITEMDTNVKAMVKDLVDMYNKYAEVFDIKDSKTSPKPGLTSFLYGAISSHLENTFIYRIAGKGYANIVFHVPKNNWNDIPIVLERGLKKTSAFVKTMFYSLSIKSLSKRGLAIVIDTSQPSEVEVHHVNMPVPKKFVTEISTITKPIADNIREILRYQYYNISNMALKTKGTANDHYHRGLIIGQLLADPSINAYFYNAVNTKFSSFAVNDAALHKWTQINLLENSKSKKLGYQFDADGFNPPNTLPSAYSTSMLVNKIDIKLNTRSKHGWIVSEKLEVTNPVEDKYYYYQGVETSSSDLKSFTGKLEDYTRLEPVNVQDLFKGTETNPSSAMQVLKGNLKKVSNFINSESDFQAILHGMFLNNKKEPTLTESGYMYRVFVESNPAKSGRIDLLVQKFEIDIHNQYHEKELIVMELKYTDKNDAEKMLNSAEDQGTKYEANLPSFTNLDSFTLIPMVYERKSGDILYKIKQNQSIREATLKRPIDELDPNPTKKPRQERSLHIEQIEQTNSSIDSFPAALAHQSELIPQSVLSKGTRLEFWPLSLAKTASTAVLSLLSSWTNSNNKPTKTPTVLEMGDNWVQSTDTNALLIWGIYFANKVTGYRPKPIPQEHFDDLANTELQIRSTIIVDRFMDSLLESIETNNFKSRDIFENTIMYCDAIKNVRQKLSAGDIQNIPDMLFKLIVKNNMKTQMADEIFTQMSNSNTISEFIEFINQQEHEWLSHKPTSTKLSDFEEKYQQPQSMTHGCVLPKDFPNVDFQNNILID